MPLDLPFSILKMVAAEFTEMLNLKMVQQSKKMMLINLLRLFLKSLSL